MGQIRTQIVCMGASSTYGVGGTVGGWPDLLKKAIHERYYASGGEGQMYEVYNLGVPGATINHQLGRIPTDLKSIHKPGRKLVSIMHGGANNALAKGTPDNFVSTPEAYRKELMSFLAQVKDLSDEFICLGMAPMNQDKVMPIVKDVEKNDKVYFPNDRIRMFEQVIAEVAQELGVHFIPLFDECLEIGWIEKYQYEDGIHPNDAGYEWLYQKVRTRLNELKILN